MNFFRFMDSHLRAIPGVTTTSLYCCSLGPFKRERERERVGKVVVQKWVWDFEPKLWPINNASSTEIVISSGELIFFRVVNCRSLLVPLPGVRVDQAGLPQWIIALYYCPFYPKVSIIEILWHSLLNVRCFCWSPFKRTTLLTEVLCRYGSLSKIVWPIF